MDLKKQNILNLCQCVYFWGRKLILNEWVLGQSPTVGWKSITIWHIESDLYMSACCWLWHHHEMIYADWPALLECWIPVYQIWVDHNNCFSLLISSFAPPLIITWIIVIPFMVVNAIFDLTLCWTNKILKSNQHRSYFILNLYVWYIFYY